MLETIPTYLKGCPPRNFIGWWDAIKTLPGYGTLLFPLAFGTPDGLDVQKVFGTYLFDVAFLGSTIFILGTIGLFRKKAPTTAKLLFITGLILPLTPAATWLYHRCTPIFALGCVWLAAWMLTTLRNDPRHTKLLKSLTIAYISITGLWLLASIAIHLTQPELLEFLSPKILAQLSADKIGRADWMLQRTATFLSRSKIWHPQTLLMHLLVLGGLLTLTKIHIGNRRAHRYACILALIVFCEIFLYSRTWITFSDRPNNEDDLYNTPAWVATLKEEAGNGAIAVGPREVFDYLQINTPSSHGIRFQSGYETVTPLRCSPITPIAFNPEDYAQAGVSLYLITPEITPTNVIAAGWPLVHDSQNFKLYRNPAFASRILAITDTSADPIPVFLTTETANTRTFTVPAGTRSVKIGETYNRGWTARANENPLDVTRTDRNGIEIQFRNPTIEPTTVELRFSPHLRQIYHPVMGFALFSLLLLTLIQHRKRTEHQLIRPSV